MSTFKPKKIRISALTSIGGMVSSLLEPLWAQHQALEVRLMREWLEILGSPFGEESFPEKLTFERSGGGIQSQGGVLQVRVTSGRALAFQYQLPFILNRINGHFGYKVVARISLKQTSLSNSTPPQASKAFQPKGLVLGEGTRESMEAIQDEKLQEALLELGSMLSNSYS